MPKRFTDTDKWKKPFLRGLEGPYKLLWFYILDDCDHAGIWQVDFEVASIRIGEKIIIQNAIKLFGDRIEIFDNGSKWFVKDFIAFQYGELSEKNRLHLSVINILKKYQVGPYKPLPRGQGQGIIQGQGNEKGQGQGTPPDYEQCATEETVVPLEKSEIDFTKPDIDGDTIIFPMDTKPVRELWATWKKYRWEQYRARYKLMGEQSDLKRLEGMAYSDIEKTILTAIANNWKNLYPEKNGTSRTKSGGDRQQRNAATIEYLKNHYGDKSGK